MTQLFQEFAGHILNQSQLPFIWLESAHECLRLKIGHLDFASWIEH